jgi:nicotinate phosphoribosyltransferase
MKSILETDTYKIRMLYFIWKFFRNVKNTKFAFTNRTTKIRLAEKISIAQVREQFTVAREMQFGEKEIAKIAHEYPQEFLQFLRTLRLSEISIERTADGQFRIETALDYWIKTTLWELIVLPIISELYCQAILKEKGISDEQVFRAGEERLKVKAEMLKGSGVKALQFALRRRLSGAYERFITERALDLMPDVIVAISNIELALELGMPYGGTNAHELYSAVNAIRRKESLEASRYAPYEVAEKWFQLFNGQNRVLLPDTFGSKYFFDNIPENVAREVMAFRQDSGDPVQFGYWAIDAWKRFEINPLERTLLFSDGLNPQKMLTLYQEFNRLVNVLFGWGTNFGNDTGFIIPISIVMKLVMADGMNAIKLSDNLAKAIGALREIEIESKNFGYDVTFNEGCIY